MKFYLLSNIWLFYLRSSEWIVRRKSNSILMHIKQQTCCIKFCFHFPALSFASNRNDVPEAATYRCESRTEQKFLFQMGIQFASSVIQAAAPTPYCKGVSVIDLFLRLLSEGKQTSDITKLFVNTVQ